MLRSHRDEREHEVQDVGRGNPQGPRDDREPGLEGQQVQQPAHGQHQDAARNQVVGRLRSKGSIGGAS